MEIRTWKPGETLDAETALALVDPAIVERLTRRRSFVGDRAPYLDEALRHCTRPMLLRRVRRPELPVEPVERTAQPWPSPPLEPRREPPPRVAILSKELGKIRTASYAARRAFIATRALRRRLLRTRLR